MKKYKFILNRRSGVLHHFPANEACNIDAIPRRGRLYFDLGRSIQRGYGKAKLSPFFKRLCRRCF